MEDVSKKKEEDKDNSLIENKGGDSDENHYQKLHQYALQHMHQVKEEERERWCCILYTNLLLLKGRHDVAVSLCKKAVHELERTSGRFHPERANMINVMVVIYR